jgi:hypothetical protein
MTMPAGRGGSRRNDIPVLLLALFAGPYRVLAFKARSFGGLDTGAMTWISILLLFPLWTGIAFLEASGAALLWLMLIACAYLQMMVKWCSQPPAPDPCVPHCWMGQGEPFLAAVLYFATAAACDNPAAGTYFVIGYACSMAEWRLQRWRRDAPETTLADVVSARQKRFGRIWASSLWPALAPPLGWLRSFLTGKRPAGPAPAGGPAVPAGSPVQVVYASHSGWGRRLATFFVGHTILSLLGLSFFLKIIAVPLALFLASMGYRIGLPDHMKQEVKSTVHRIREALSDEKEELMERFHDKREELQQRFDQRLEQEKQRLREEFSRRKEQMQRGYLPYRSFGERNR